MKSSSLSILVLYLRICKWYIEWQRSIYRGRRHCAVVHDGLSPHSMSGRLSCNADCVFYLWSEACKFLQEKSHPWNGAVCWEWPAYMWKYCNCLSSQDIWRLKTYCNWDIKLYTLDIVIWSICFCHQQTRLVLISLGCCVTCLMSLNLWINSIMCVSLVYFISFLGEKE